MTGLHGPFDHAVRRITVSGIHHRLAIAHLSLLACLVAAPAIAAELTLPAGGCPLPPDNVPALPDVAPGMTVMEADAVALYQQDAKAVFSGNVLLQQDDVRLSAGRIVYLQQQQRISAEGGVKLVNPDIRLFSEQVEYQLSTGQGSAEQARFEIPVAGARGRAAHIELPGHGSSHHTDISYTTCLENNQVWLLSAAQLDLDHDAGLGTVRQARLKIRDVPVLYLPGLTFPIDGKRHSGFLVPTIGYSGSNGLDIQTPYYLNLAPDHDVTLMPRLMTGRGLLLGAEARFLTEHQSGSILGEWLPDDSKKDTGDGQRGYLALTHDAQLSDNWRSSVRAAYASDHNYLDDLGRELTYTSQRDLERVWELRYLGRDWQLLGRVQHFQILDQTLAPADRPYSRWPQQLFHLDKPLSGGLRLGLEQEYVNFHRDTGTTGQRLDIKPSLRYRWDNPWAYLAPRISARYTAYQLSDLPAGQPASPSRTIGSASLDGGLFFERPLRLFRQRLTQTLEPRLHYLYVPKVGQDALPVFDTDRYDFSFDSLFRDDRFNGPDRVGDANRLTLALSSRLLKTDDGREIGHLSIGQVLHFADRTVTLPGATAGTDSRSSLAFELAATPHRHWSFDTALAWDPNRGDQGTIEQAIARVAYSDHPNRRIHAGYRLREGEVDQFDLAATWPVGADTQAIARWTYSTQDNRTLDAIAGVEFGDCCWRLRSVLRQHASEDGSSSDLALLLQFELRGLARIGSNIDHLLSGRLAGFRSQ